MYAERAPGFKYRIRDSGKVWIVFWNKMEAENVLAWLNVYAPSKQNELIWSIQPFTAKNIYKPQVQTQLLQLGKGLVSDACTS